MSLQVLCLVFNRAVCVFVIELSVILTDLPELPSWLLHLGTVWLRAAACPPRAAVCAAVAAQDCAHLMEIEMWHQLVGAVVL